MGFGGGDCGSGCVGRKLCSKCSAGTRYILRSVIVGVLLVAGLKKRLARVGNTADRDNSNPPRWIMILFLACRGRCLSASEWRLDSFLQFKQGTIA